MALKPKADIVFANRRKHMAARRFHRKVAPFLRDTFGQNPDRIAVIRDPEEQIRSWYKYRTRPERSQTDRDTSNLSFDEFVLDVISDEPSPAAGIGSQFRALTSGRGQVLVHHLFAYEQQKTFRDFLSGRFEEEIVLKQRNVSPQVDAPLSEGVRKQLRQARAAEIELYERVRDADGHLQTEI